ncbi:MAG: hypothetical protein WA941_09080 [Nitrososphaeraceae archaeon]
MYKSWGNHSCNITRFKEKFKIAKKYKLVRCFFLGRKMNINYKTTIVVFAVLSVLIVTIISAYSAILTQVIQQTQAQILNVTEQRAYITDVNVHFKTACVSVIVFTYCW